MNGGSDRMGSSSGDFTENGSSTARSLHGVVEQQPGTISSRGKFQERAPAPVFWMREVSKPYPASIASPINVEPGASAKAIFSEIQVCAERLVAQDETSSIDLRFLKSMPDERATLATLLGHGEVSAIVDSIGRSEIQETAIPCVWWIRHFNSDNETVGELIEITDIPELLKGDRTAVAFVLESLRTGVRSGAC